MLLSPTLPALRKRNTAEPEQRITEETYRLAQRLMIIFRD
jgi:hypothetical protein